MYIVVGWKKEHEVNKGDEMFVCYVDARYSALPTKRAASYLIKSLKAAHPKYAYKALKVEDAK